MQNRFIFSLRFSSKVFFKLALLGMTMIFFMTLFRANLFFLSVIHAVQNLEWIEIWHSFLAGARFDLLVIGFIMAPLTLLVLLQAFMEKWPSWMFMLYRIYLGTFWIAICATTYVDFFFFARAGKRMRFNEYMNWNMDSLRTQMSTMQNNTDLIFSIITVLLLILGLSLVFGLKFGQWKDEYSPRKGGFFEVLLRVLLPIVLVALAARGTVEAHHLALEHSEVSNNTAINEMALNAPWCFDK